MNDVLFLFLCQLPFGTQEIIRFGGEFHSLNKDGALHLTHIHPPPTHRHT